KGMCRPVKPDSFKPDGPPAMCEGTLAMATRGASARTAEPSAGKAAHKKMAGDNRYAVEAVARAARVLALFDRARPRQSLAELAEQSGVPKATLRGILDTLATHDLVLEEAEGMYRLGYAWLRYGDLRRTQLD